MSDELERQLRRIPDRVPPAAPEVTAGVREDVLRASRPRYAPPMRRLLLVAAALALVTGTGFTAGRWARPTHAAADVTIGARPDIVDSQRGTQVTLFGTIANGRAGESVQIEANECGLSGQFHELQGVRTEAQGVWSMPIPGNNPATSKAFDYIRTKTLYRARWNGRVSDTIAVSARPGLELRQFPAPPKTKLKPGRRFFAITVGGREMKYRKKVLVERRVGDKWSRVGSVFVNGGLFLGPARASKGWVVRARLPESEAAPCYLGAATPPTKVK